MMLLDLSKQSFHPYLNIKWFFQICSTQPDMRQKKESPGWRLGWWFSQISSPHPGLNPLFLFFLVGAWRESAVAALECWLGPTLLNWRRGILVMWMRLGDAVEPDWASYWDIPNKNQGELLMNDCCMYNFPSRTQGLYFVGLVTGG